MLSGGSLLSEMKSGKNLHLDILFCRCFLNSGGSLLQNMSSGGSLPPEMLSGGRLTLVMPSSGILTLEMSSGGSLTQEMPPARPGNASTPDLP